MQKRERFFIFIIFCLCGHILFDFWLPVSWIKFSPDQSEFDVFDTCPLKIYDPYYKEMGLTIRLLNPLEGCNKNYKPFTKLENGNAFIHPEKREQVSYCRGRCYTYVHATKSTPKPWVNMTGDQKIVVPCDFFKTECFSKEGKSVDPWMHVQIVETNHSTVKVEKVEFPGARPDIFIFVFDSVSSTQARRTIPRTLSFLETKMGAVQFYHLNKVGDNSPPNAYGFLMGWRTSNVNRVAVGGTNLKPQYPKNVWCNQYHDNDSVIYREFEKIGYKTAYNDDYKYGPAFTWPNCKNFKNQEANHIIRTLATVYQEDKDLKKYMSKGNCWEMQKHELLYMKQFIDSYKGKPKFGINWSNTLTHDDANLLFHADEDFLAFFQENQKKLENSFIILVGDHGMRFGSTMLGKREIKNPLLQISVPKFLRKNKELMRNLDENAQRLVTHYDIYATLNDILKFGLPSNFSDFSEKEVLETNENNGTSLLRPFSEKYQKRTCRNIPIDTSYCLCEYEKEEITDKKLGKAAGGIATFELNKLISDKEAENLCHKLTLDTIKLLGFVPVEKTRTFEAVFKMKPSNGKFSTILKLDSPNSLQRAGEILRINRYGNQSVCLNSLPAKYNDIMQYCFCK